MKEMDSEMKTREGVIKFHLEFAESACVESAMIAEIDGWRSVMHRLQLIGQTPERYNGFGFGNISCRCPAFGGDSFLISGTQTGSFDRLTAEQYALVSSCRPEHDFIAASGRIRPSSEALTHGQVYLLDPAVQCVIHVHSPEIWRQAGRLGIPATPAGIDYGTQAMAQAVSRLFDDGAVRAKRCFVMTGHEDGVVSFGNTADQAGLVLLALLARALMKME